MYLHKNITLIKGSGLYYYIVKLQNRCKGNALSMGDSTFIVPALENTPVLSGDSANEPVL